MKIDDFAIETPFLKEVVEARSLSLTFNKNTMRFKNAALYISDQNFLASVSMPDFRKPVFSIDLSTKYINVNDFQKKFFIQKKLSFACAFVTMGADFSPTRRASSAIRRK